MAPPPAASVNTAGTSSTGVAGTPVLGATPTTPAAGGAGAAGPTGAIVTHVPLGHINGTAAWPSGVSSGMVPVLTAAAQKPLPASTNKDGKRFIAYWSAWHGTGLAPTDLPSAKHLKGVTHLILGESHHHLMVLLIRVVSDDWQPSGTLGISTDSSSQATPLGESTSLRCSRSRRAT